MLVAVFILYIVHYKTNIMTKTHIIGHRGAAGLALENTMPAFEKAVAAGVKAIEFDVQTTKDGIFVVNHDSNLARVSQSSDEIAQLTLHELQAIRLDSGANVPTLTEVLDFARTKQLTCIVEIKHIPDIESFCALIDTYADLVIIIASFKHDVLQQVRRLRPAFSIYLAEAFRPVKILMEAKAMKAQGVDLNYTLMNPLTYILAKLWKLDVMLYTVNSPFIVRMLTILYPGVFICTNYPDRFITTAKRSKAA